MPNFLFGGNTGTTYEQLQQRQAVANRLLAANARTPQNVGEGLNAVGRAIAERMMRRQNMTTESQLQGEFDAQMAALFGGGPGGAGTTASGRSFAPGSGGSNTAGAASAVSGNTNAPTAGLRHMLPDTDPDLMDPRRASFPTAAPRVDDPNVFTTDISGATDGVNPDLLRAIGNSVEQSYGPGASVGVTSGRRHGHAGGSDHNSGEAADFNVTDRFGVQSTAADPRVFDAARVASGDGVRAVGIGPDYMGGNHYHFGTGEGQGIPNARAWSDWNTGAELARYGRNSAGAGGAGDPNFSFANEMQGIMDGRAVPTGTTGTRGAATAVANPPAAPAPQGGALATTASAQNAPQGQGALPPDIEALKAQSSGGGVGSAMASGDPMARIAALTQLMNNPMASEGQRMVLGAMLQQGMRQAFPGPAQRMENIELQLAELELERALSNGGVDFNVLTPEQEIEMGLNPDLQYQIGPDNRIHVVGGGGSSVTVENNMPGQDAFDEVFAEQDARMISDISEAGLAAQRNIGRIDQLATLLENSPTGAGAALRVFAGDLGINTEGLDELQAAQAIINALVPEQRQPGSGPMSDADLALFQLSLPRLINTPEGNRLIISTMRAIAEYDAEGARIVQRLRSGELTREQAFVELQSRENPLSGLRAGQADVSGPAEDDPSSEPGATVSNPIRFNTEEELDAAYPDMPVGTFFLTPDGTLMRKSEPQP